MSGHSQDIDGKPAPVQSRRVHTFQPPELALVKFWTREDYKKRPRHGQGTGQGANEHAMSFITGKDGVPITELYAKDIRSGIRLHWHDWIISGKPVPASWMQVGAVAMGKYYDFAAETYPPVGLCANNWKAHKIGLTYYPAWIQANAAKIKTAAEKSRQSEIEQGALALQISSGGTALDLKRPRRTDESASTRKRVKKEVKEENSKSV